MLEKRKGTLTLIIVAMVTLFLSAGLNAGDFPEMIKMQSPEYAEHTKGIVEFSHGKHADEYEIGCGECHHDDKGQPLELKKGDPVQRCIECHKEPGERPKGKDAPKLSKEERLAFHAEALHYNCKDCHKDHNKENNTKAAPTTCTQCHPKTN